MSASVDRKRLERLCNMSQGEDTEVPHVQGAGWRLGASHAVSQGFRPCAMFGAQPPPLLMVSSTV